MPDHEGTPSWEKLYHSAAAERDRLAEQVAANRGRYESARRERDTMAAIILAYQTAALDQGWVVEFEDESGSWQARPRQPGEF